MHRLLATAVLGGVLGSALATYAQSPPQAGQQKHSFEVVSVKPSAAANDSTSVNTTPYRIRCENVLVRQVLMMGFDIRSESQIENMPDWAKSERFNIDAKVDEETAAAMKSLPRDERQKWQQEMMQALLEDRFHLKFHWEKKELPVYSLTVAKSGSKLKATVPPPPPPGADPNAKPQDRGTSSSTHNGHMVVTNGSMEMFAYQLSHMTEMDSRVVLDRTNLPGRFDWTLDWSPERQQNSFHGADGNPAPAPTADTSKPTLFTALQEQLGLKVEQAKAPVDLLVIDDLERPTEN
ncbi:TIGR03435 family protein [Terriglobus sp. 2YAB30_2]|uniref:TIGR03435 family protein n=1 Tax=unclassified Terriglobus TaxID=2628988 RepID=UPI003F9A9560